jgi:DNA repair protein RadD
MIKLRPYQQEAVDKTIDFFRKSIAPAVVVLPTGAGKSIVIAELARIAKGRVLVLAHVKELVEQNFQKLKQLDMPCGIYSAGLNRKDAAQKIIFGSIQSVANAEESFFENFSLLIIDECHRVAEDNESQYQMVIHKLLNANPQMRILGLTATPYRLGLGWIYEFNQKGEIKTTEKRFFKQCVFELPLNFLIRNHFLTPPVKIDLPVTCYDFSELTEKNRLYTTSEVDELLKKQKRLTPLIIKNIIDITENYNRQGVMLFASTITHAKEILTYLPPEQSRLVIGETHNSEREKIIEEFKAKKIKYLVNVSVLTTGFDAPHVDVIAILRPTESVSLYQQIIGRGLRLAPLKKDCLILDYTGMRHDIYTPEVSDKKPSKESVPVQIECPNCHFVNDFWGLVNLEGEVVEHYGRKCRGATQDQKTLTIIPCGHRFRYKICHHCGKENDVTASKCDYCQTTLIDADSKLKQARLSKEAYIMRPDSVQLSTRQDKNGEVYLDIRYYDYDGKHLQEMHYLNNPTAKKKFLINFLRSHLKRPEQPFLYNTPSDVLLHQNKLRMPSFIIARQNGKFWKITEKIFSEELFI